MFNFVRYNSSKDNESRTIDKKTGIVLPISGPIKCSTLPPRHLESQTTKCFPVLWFHGNQREDPGPATSTPQGHCSLEPKFWGSPYTNFNKTLGVGHRQRSFVQPSEQHCSVGNMEKHYSKWKIILAGSVLLRLWVQSTPSELGKWEASFWQPALWQSHYCHLSYLKQIIKSATSLYKYTQKNICFFFPLILHLHNQINK